MDKQGWRILAVLAIFCTSGIGLATRVFWLQVRNGGHLELDAKAVAQQQVPVSTQRPRRSIRDRQGNLLAGDRLTYDLYVHPRYFSQTGHEPAAVAEFLAAILPDRDAESLQARFAERNSGIRLINGLSEEDAQRVRRGIETVDEDGETQYRRVAGLDLQPHYARYYPHGELAASVIGYVQQSDGRKGQAGLEFLQEQQLTRNNAIGAEPIKTLRSGSGRLLPEALPPEIRDLDDRSLQLTLDVRLQRVARDALKRQMQAFGAKRGAVVVMDVHNGEILSLVSLPSYDPNQYFKYLKPDAAGKILFPTFGGHRFARDPELNPFTNWTITDLYEPGSTFKPINLAIALDAGVVSPHLRVSDPGKVHIGGWPIHNHNFFTRGGNGVIGLPRILQVSSNVGMIRVMSRLSSSQYYNKLLELGLQEKTGVDLPGEMAGRLKSEFQFVNYPIEPAVAAFGQGFSLTPIKLAQLHAAIANGGKLVTPHAIAGWVDTEGRMLEPAAVPVPKQVLKPEATQQILEMMETVVTRGSGKSSQVPGYRIGGKTGTAQKAGRNRSGYGSGKITSFVALLPVNQPRYVVLAVVDEPTKGMAFGSTVAAPIAKDVMETLIAIAGLPPTSDPHVN